MQCSLCSLSLVPRRIYLGLSDVDLSTRAWYLVHDIRLLLDGERVFDLSKHGPERRARSKHHSDVIVPARLSDPLTNACYIRQHHQRRLALSLWAFSASSLRSTRMPMLEAIPTSQLSPNMLGQRTTPSTGVVLRFCSAPATPWSW